MTRCEEVAKGYLASNELRGLKIAQLLGGVAGNKWSRITSHMGESCLWKELLLELAYR